MAEKKEPIIYVADFETTVYSKEDLEKLNLEEQEQTEVWSAAIMRSVGPEEIEDEPVYVYNNIFEFMNKLEALENNAIVYFHNLKFDGSYLLNHIIDVENWTPCIALDSYNAEEDEYEGVPTYGSKYDMIFQPYTYAAFISGMNQWYKILLHFDHKFVELRDSAKLIPSTLADMAKDFGTKFQKLEMKYDGLEHKAFGAIKGIEVDYIKNDVRVLSEAIWKIRKMGLTKLTIGACALNELKNVITPPVFDYLFPDLREEKIPTEHENIFNYVQKSYFGGWCYVNKRYQAKVYATEEAFTKAPDLIRDDANIVDNIWCADVNSEYPWALHSVPEEDLERWGHHYYPVGEGTYLTGEPSEGEIEDCCVFRRFKCHFDLKPERFPFIHIRNSSYYRANECLETDKVMGKRILPNGESTKREFIMTQVDFELFKYCYDISEYEPIDYVIFQKEEGIFDPYIDKWMENKIKGKKEGNPTLTKVSKLLLNSVYGKLGTALRSDSRFCEMEDGVLKFRTHFANDKTPVAMAAAAYCTAYARSNVIRAAIANYDYFTYADTDSIHGFSTNGHTVQGIKVDKTKLGYWDMEVENGLVGTWVKQKTYIEVAENLDKKTGKPYNEYIIRAAGLSDNGKNILKQALLLDRSKNNTIVKNGDDDYKVSKLFINDFRPGFGMKGVNLKAKQIKGGVLLTKDDFSLN